jgi:Glycine zipper
MRKIILASVAVAALFPATAMAKHQCDRSDTGQIVGTVAGAGVGAGVGTAIAGRGDNTEGAIIGGVIGAVVGNRVGNGIDKNNRCDRAYGYYDQDGSWHATGVSARDARGYYDRDQRWVEGTPTGYYSNGRWVAISSDSSAAGYSDSNGDWVPASVTGYYDRDGNWKSRPASGYYDERGRWVAGPVRGHYDSRGRWMEEDPRYERGSDWATVDQPGYYDTNGRWVAGTSHGYYDGRGKWVSIGQQQSQSNRYPYNLGAMPYSVDARIDWLNSYVDSAGSDRRLGSGQARMFRQELGMIERQKSQFQRSGGRFTRMEEQNISSRLDRLSRRMNVQSYMANR